MQHFPTKLFATAQICVVATTGCNRGLFLSITSDTNDIKANFLSIALFERANIVSGD